MAKLTNTNLAITSDDERKTSHCPVFAVNRQM
jgi:hypothetical protein